jgi:hypothetical protein
LIITLLLGVLGMAMSSWSPPLELPEVSAVECQQQATPTQC